MIYKIGNVKDIDKISDISNDEKAVIHKFANILTSMYGSDRDIDNDYGGYILFATKGTTNEEIKAVFDYEANLVEYTELHEGNICAAIYITSTEFGVVLIIHLDDAPDVIRNSIQKQIYMV
jgi:hypothetical protein